MKTDAQNRLKTPELRGFHGIIETAPKSACNTHQGLTRISTQPIGGIADMLPEFCSIEGCESAKYCRGWCIKHYGRYRSHGDPLTVFTQVKAPCTVESCDLKQHSHGYCPSHLYHHKKYGDPLAVGPGRHSGRKRMAAPGYDGAHKRLHRERGKASAYCCVECGNRAKEWSYDGGCPNELYEVLIKVPVAYSVDTARYSPRCLSCHRKRDESSDRFRGADGRFMA